MLFKRGIKKPTAFNEELFALLYLFIYISGNIYTLLGPNKLINNESPLWAVV